MEQFLDDKSIYVIDLGHINTSAEIIFELSSILDKEETKNKKICLKIGNVILNQSQLLSIKSLINGNGSILSSVDTKSTETEKVALSLGIIISNASSENITDDAPAMPYKTVEELKEEIENSKNKKEQEETEEISEIVEENTEDIIEQSDSEIVELQEDEDEKDNIDDEKEEIKEEEKSETEQKTKEEDIQEQKEINNETSTENKEENKEDVKDELDVIFGSSPVEASIFDSAVPKELVEENKGLADIIVPEQEYTKEDIELESFPTKYIKQTIRSGQVINYEGNIIIIGDCHPGCEIAAFGDITVWGVLSGIAHAGNGGNQKARVRALKMNAIQLRIANCYSRRPDSMNTVYIEKTDSFTPEEARIVNGEIVVFKMND